MIRAILVTLSAFAVINCGSSSSSSSDETTVETDITDIEFTARESSCSDYISEFFSNVIDENTSAAYTGDVSITSGSSECTITANSIPNHNFDARSFASDVAEVSTTYTIATTGAAAATPTNLWLGASGIFLNGVKLDLLSAACFDEGSETIGQEKSGCSNLDHPWRYDPMSPDNNFGTDDNNAHTQPSGAYHYHGDPLAMFDAECESTGIASPVIGFAADGFPIFGYCFDDNGTVRKAESGYTLKTGTRASVTGYTTPYVTGSVISTTYNGQFLSDYEHTGSVGDLDECNGMTVDGVYGYYVTEAFPWVMNCLTGTVNSNFEVKN